MKRKLFLVFLFALGLYTVEGQTLAIKGQVLDDSSNAGLSGVSVSVAETRQGVSTDQNGNFSINVPARSSAKVTFTYVGYASQTVTARNGENLLVRLRKGQGNLDDVVVVGYSSVRRRDLTGSVSSVNAKQLRDVPLSSAAEALTGRLAGVQVTSAEGAPGAEVVIRIRGGGSITQDNSPIYIVDGIQVENALQVISPQDIASIDVLKDASTTAIYGARGANGVVIITTKSGRSGKTVVSYNGAVGFRQIFRKMDVLNPYEFVVAQWERSRLAGTTEIENFNKIYGSTWDTLNVYKNIPEINWQDQVFGRKAPYLNNNVSISGGNANTTFNLSLTANDEKGILLESGFNRKLVNFKLDHRASDKFRVGLTVRYIDQVIKGAGTTESGTRTTNRLRHSIQYRPFDIPTAPSIDEFDEDAFRISAGLTNPILLNGSEYRRAYTRGINLSGYINYSIVRNLNFRSTFGFDNSSAKQNAFSGVITSLARNNASLPVVVIGSQETRTINNSNTLQYTRTEINEAHDIDVLVGQEIYELKGNTLGTEVRYFPAGISPENAFARLSAGNPPAGSGFQQPNPVSNVAPPGRIFSLFGRVNYAFKKKFLATVSVRSDRSTKFSYENGALVFPSGTIAYRFGQEKFMEGVGFINDAKIRVGYGAAGNNRIGDLLYLQLYNISGQYALNHAILTANSPQSLANPSLKWEKNISQNVGLDLSFFRSRLQLTVDAYKNKGNNLLLAVNIPPTLGYTQQIQNVGSTSNTGLEFQINATPIQKKNFNWSSNFNLSFNKNRVENLGPIRQTTRSAGWQGSDGADDYLVKVGEPVGLMYGFVTDGMYKIEDFDYNTTTGAYRLKTGIPDASIISGTIRPGALKIRDINGDGRITSDSDRTVIGRANPKFMGGWNNQFTYKNFDLSVFVNWVVGNDIYNANKIEWTDASFPNLNVLGIMRDRWTNINSQGQVVTDPKELATINANAKIWSPVNSNRFFLHSWAVEDGSFLRLNNVTLGYTIPQKALQRLKISNLRIYGTVNNLATFTNYTGYDPEVNTRRSDPLTPGVDFAGYPRTKTWVFGINLSL
ncbi:MAG: TonB-dependent receptor [Segetibacter sp.]|nr:TonB-dependent receptor [Segetibacter sp.]